MPCFHDLATALQSNNNAKIKGTKIVDLYDLGITDKSRISNATKFYNIPPVAPALAKSRPWKTDPHYFSTCYISSLALMKMSIHAQSGGNIEVMGMLIGKVIPGAIIIMDVYALPVEGTETRVNAQAEAYEYMVQYLEMNKKITGRNENIVGWYHSHPGYGCWLSGIDVSTQSLNQGFQDPYLAIVVDPIKTVKQGKVEIGAFRTFPENYVPTSDGSHLSSKPAVNIPKAKRKDFGSHFDKYYPLDIEIFSSDVDGSIIQMLKLEDSITWLNSLLKEQSDDDIVKVTKKNKYIKSMDLVSNYDLVSNGNDSSSTKSYLFTLIQQLNNHKVPIDFLVPRKFESYFEDVIYTKLLAQGTKTQDKKNARNRRSRVVEMSEDEVMDESDLENDSRGISDGEDAASMGSGSVNAGDELMGIEQVQEGDEKEKEKDKEEEDEEDGDDEVEQPEEVEEEEEEDYDDDGHHYEVDEATLAFNRFSGIRRPRSKDEPIGFGSGAVLERRPRNQRWNSAKGLTRESKLSRSGWSSDVGNDPRPNVNRGTSTPNMPTSSGSGSNASFFITPSDSGSSGNPNSRFLADEARSLRKIRGPRGRMPMSESFSPFKPNPYAGMSTPTTRLSGEESRVRASRLEELAQLATGVGQREVYDLITLEMQERLFM